MKNYIHLFLVKIRITIMSLMMGLAFLSCTLKEKVKTQTTVFIDITGSNTHTLEKINPSTVFKVMQIDKYSSFENNYKQAYITESFLSKKQEFHLEKSPNWLLGNQYDREAKINTFKKQINDCLLKAKKQTKGRNASSVYLPFAKEVNRLADLDATHKTLIVYSDLVENADWFTLVKQRNLNQLLRKPEEIEKIFSKEYKLVRNLQGITVYLVYQPYNETETIYRKLSGLYKHMLEKRGAKVYVEANL
jgi:hypothetical protein